MRHQKKHNLILFVVVAAVFLLCSFISAYAQSTRIKDLVNIRGYRSNQLVGFGLVIGLSGSGDSPKTLATNQAVSSMMTRLGIKMEPKDAVTQSVAAVIATVDLPAFKRIGDRVDVKISTIGDAKSLAGGTLLLTPLKAGDGQIYVVGQGSVVIGQANGSGSQVLTTALVPNGGVVEREFKPVIAPNGVMTLSLNEPDFTTSSRIAEEVNINFKGFYAKAVDPSSIEVEVPPLFTDRLIEFISELEGLQVDADQKAVVVLNERTGTVVMGSEVVIGKIAIAHGDLSIEIGKGGAGGKQKAKGQKVVNMGGATVGSLVETMNALGMKPADLVGILQAVHAAGALKADLKFL